MDRNYILNLQGKELNDLVSHEIMGREGDWSESISAAWEVVMYMKKEWSVTMTTWGGDDPFEIVFGYAEGPYRYSSTSISEAICKAALLTRIDDEGETP